MKVSGVIFEFENKMVLLFRDFYEKHYMVPCCSCVAFIWCIFFALVIVVPWIAAWSAGGEFITLHISWMITPNLDKILYGLF